MLDSTCNNDTVCLVLHIAQHMRCYHDAIKASWSSMPRSIMLDSTCNHRILHCSPLCCTACGHAFQGSLRFDAKVHHVGQHLQQVSHRFRAVSISVAKSRMLDSILNYICMIMTAQDHMQNVKLRYIMSTWQARGHLQMPLGLHETAHQYNAMLVTYTYSCQHVLLHSLCCMNKHLKSQEGTCKWPWGCMKPPITPKVQYRSPLASVAMPGMMVW